MRRVYAIYTSLPEMGLRIGGSYLGRYPEWAYSWLSVAPPGLSRKTALN